MERYEEAPADFTRAIELDPAYGWAIAHRGETYRLMERHDEALADLSRAIEIDPSDGDAIASRRLLLTKMGVDEESLPRLHPGGERDG